MNLRSFAMGAIAGALGTTAILVAALLLIQAGS